MMTNRRLPENVPIIDLAPGFALPDRRTQPWLPGGRIAFWGGWGGSTASADIDRRMTISYVMNRMDADLLGSSRTAAYVGAVYDVVRVSR
jgi:CubicO group peptidase (beta-lactamase class C family)